MSGGCCRRTTAPSAARRTRLRRRQPSRPCARWRRSDAGGREQGCGAVRACAVTARRSPRSWPCRRASSIRACGRRSSRSWRRWRRRACSRAMRRAASRSRRACWRRRRCSWACPTCCRAPPTAWPSSSTPAASTAGQSRLARLVVLGCADVVTVTAIALAAPVMLGADPFASLMHACAPYFLSCAGALLLVRRCAPSQALPLACAWTLLVAAGAYALFTLVPPAYAQGSAWAWALVAAGSLVWACPRGARLAWRHSGRLGHARRPPPKPTMMKEQTLMELDRLTG